MRKACANAASTSRSTTFQQVEQLTLVTAEPFGDAMTKQNRKLYKGSSFGNKIGDVMLDSPKTLWSMTLKARIFKSTCC